MGNSWSDVKKLLCCSHDGSTSGVHQDIQNPPQSPPTAVPTLQDRLKFFKETADTLNIDALIQAIDQLLKSKLSPASTSAPDAPSGSTDLIPNWTYAIGSGATFLKFINEHSEKTHVKDDFFGSGQGQKMVEEILQQIGQLHWIVGGLSIIAYLLNKVDKVSENRSECLRLLKCMFDLAKHIKKLKSHLPGEEEKLRDAFVVIFEGCMTCASQLNSGRFFRFLKSSVDSQALNNLISKINRLYQDLTLTTVTETQTTVIDILTTVTEIQRDQPVVLPVRPPVYPEGAGDIDGKDAISSGPGRMADSNPPKYTNPIPEQTIKDLPPGANATQMASNVKDVHVQDAGNVKDVKGERNEVKAGNFNFGRIKDELQNLPPEPRQKTSNVSDIDVKDAGNVKDVKGNDNKVRAGNFNFGGVS